ncbi:MAG: VOC family protein [Chloroflexi bacterium]|nr:VOC family protein [Chloroflexota bacterium]
MKVTNNGSWEIEVVPVLTDSEVTFMLPVTQLERARKFYELTLGLRLLWTTPSEAWYECGKGSRLCLYRQTSPSGQNAIVSWEVPNLERAVKELRRKGITFEESGLPIQSIDGIADPGMAKKAWFKDTEDNILAITQANYATRKSR